ncbi:hypothetical protein MODO_3269 [Myroides odoratimimus]|uniref:Uncharacterized protein n=1 Tax=Myroides odoratimimus CCUG 10230 TaxID=883150 RepID=A0ABP2NA02_9FLAO|nr:hypothetical protein HMPREF9712_02489 [Myroides odoratimimus CCUG 10230]EKB07836.1 hypothetical protein HMPREF9711_00126 [Myroides odoratimimus CCUG 3837]GAQ15572.1 hypothetical protein MODO_3269 [Myroides odoratimimus]STZ48061.1 Uncharacterised protein [Myroides odoratimimus]
MFYKSASCVFWLLKKVQVFFSFKYLNRLDMESFSKNSRTK